MDSDLGTLRRRGSVDKLRSFFEAMGQNNLDVLTQSERRPSISQMKLFFEAKHKRDEELKNLRKRLKRRKSLQQMNSLLTGLQVSTPVSPTISEIASKFGGLKHSLKQLQTATNPMPLDEKDGVSPRSAPESPRFGVHPLQESKTVTTTTTTTTKTTTTITTTTTTTSTSEDGQEHPSLTLTEESSVEQTSAPVTTTTVNSLAAHEIQRPASPSVPLIKDNLGSCLTALRSNEPVTHIELKNSKVSDNAAIELAESLATNETVTHLSLDANEIEAAGAEALARALGKNAAIMSVDLQWNPIGPQGGVALADAIKLNRTLADVNLEGVGIGHVGGVALAEALRITDSLKTINLKENDLGDEAVAAIADALSENNCVRKLNLSNNSVAYQGSLALANCLRTNNTLAALSLNENLIYDDGAVMLADALKQNSGLKQLHMRSCFVGDDGLCALAEALIVNSTLSHLDVRLNFFSVTSELALQDAIIAKAKHVDTQITPAGRKQAYLLWKDDDVQVEWSESDLQLIIEHYGEAKILDFAFKGELLRPLIDNASIIPKLKITDFTVATGFVQRILADPSGFSLVGLEMLVSVVKNETDRTAHDAKHLPPLLKALYNNVGRFCALLKPGPTSKGVGFSRLHLIEFVKALVHLGCHPIDQQLIKSHCLQTCIDMFFIYSNNNFLHEHIVNLVAAILKEGSKDLRKELAIRGLLVRRVKDTFRAQFKLPPGQRQGYFGHLTKLANCIQDHWHAISSWVTDIPTWEKFVQTELHEINELQNTPLGGERPDRTVKPAKPVAD